MSDRDLFMCIADAMRDLRELASASPQHLGGYADDFDELADLVARLRERAVRHNQREAA